MKKDMDGNVHIYKARLVTKGFRQVHGIDYDETFSPVAMLKSIQIILSIAAYFDYEIWQRMCNCVYDIAQGFCRSNQCWIDMQTSEIYLWVEASISELEHSF
jgi:hypothetical protein